MNGSSDSEVAVFSDSFKSYNKYEFIDYRLYYNVNPALDTKASRYGLDRQSSKRYMGLCLVAFPVVYTLLIAQKRANDKEKLHGGIYKTNECFWIKKRQTSRKTAIRNDKMAVEKLCSFCIVTVYVALEAST